MIARDSDDTLLRTSEMSDIMNRAAERAIEESRRMGVPIPLDSDDGAIRYELPDGSIADEDPWHGKDTAPEGWYERFGIAPEQRPQNAQPES